MRRSRRALTGRPLRSERAGSRRTNSESTAARNLLLCSRTCNTQELNGLPVSNTIATSFA